MSKFETIAGSSSKVISNTKETHKKRGRIVGIPTGFCDLDEKLGGLHNSDLIILAGRPNMGKTSLAISIAYKASKILNKECSQKNKSVAFFSLEMSSEELATRILSKLTLISYHRIRNGDIEENELDILDVTSKEFEEAPLYIDDTPILTVSDIRDKAKTLKKEHGLELIIIDNLELLQKSDSNLQELKSLAKELDIPILCLANINQASETREDKRPLISDLNEANAIKEYADVVLFVFREVYYLEQKKPIKTDVETSEDYSLRYHKWQSEIKDKQNIAEIIVAKQNKGTRGRIELWFDSECDEFGNLLKDEDLSF